MGNGSKPSSQLILPYAVAFLAIAVAAYLFFETRRQNAQIMELLSRSNPSDSRKAQDQYLSKVVKNRILKGYPELQACYSEFLATKPTNPKGKIRVDWQITTSGKVERPEVIASDFHNQVLEKCILDKIAGWTFPEPIMKKYVEHTFVFGDKDKEAPAKSPPRKQK
ncbi:MAG: AgmX/PglI C-terminal domain-containing protein [Turneriella sp.]|nr:AgmX/PglI C-terminal domain-containing protein [Leptospiraceae bacterium]MCX7632169.1 AgmX/PglI C-terminal domain-containing protein [Turneriella sp.]